MTRHRLAIPASFVLNDRIYQQEQNFRFWADVFAQALAHRERRQSERRRVTT